MMEVVKYACTIWEEKIKNIIIMASKQPRNIGARINSFHNKVWVSGF
jgi:hypothetical protein